MIEPSDTVSDGAMLSSALKAVRRLRNLTAPETAARMHMTLRTYERFESGETRLNVDYVHRFARATDSDANGILLAVVLGAPGFAVHCADNQLATVLTSGLHNLVRTLGADVEFLTARDVVETTGAMFDELIRQAGETRQIKAAIAAGQADLDATRPRPGR